ncbi:hypothetical protein ACJMK2_000228 [Sinanodonta woodiana]|uniref:Homeobox domain-containing protein n=1 Tax=Sinanodonta woodiana TaxID=1069815 RepID=A0ABD3XQH3_SINWO
MDSFSAVPYNGQAQQAPPIANPHLACSPVGTSPPSGASDVLQQAMDLSMIASPPRSPYDYSGMFSTVTNSLSPANTPRYLSRLQRNPLLRDLHMLLAQECYGVQVPANLITTGWNLMQLPLMDSSSSAISGSQNVFLRHMQLQDKLLKVRINPHVSADGLKVENEYSTNVGQIEMRRYHDLMSNMGNAAFKTAMNSYYDKERIILVEKAERDLDRLIAKADEIRNSVTRAKEIRNSVTRAKEIRKSVTRAEEIQNSVTGANEIRNSVTRAEEIQNSVTGANEIRNSVTRAEEIQNSVTGANEIRNSVTRAEEIKNSVTGANEIRNSVTRAEEIKNSVTGANEIRNSVTRAEEIQNSVTGANEIRNSVTRAEEIQNSVTGANEIRNSVTRAEEIQNSVTGANEIRNSVTRAEEIRNSVTGANEIRNSVTRAEEIQNSVTGANEIRNSVTRAEEIQNSGARAKEIRNSVTRAEEIQNSVARTEKSRISVTRTNVMQKESSVETPVVRNMVKACKAVRHLSFGTMDDGAEKDSFDSGFKSEVEGEYVDTADISGNANINTNRAHIVAVSQSCSRKEKASSHILHEDEKHSKKTSSVQPDSTVNLSPVKPFSDKSYLINCENLKTPDQHRSFEIPFNCLDLSHSTPRTGFKDTFTCTPELGNNPSIELSPLNDHSDFLLRIACESSRKSNEVQSDSRSQAQSHIEGLYRSKSKASSSPQQNSNLDKAMDPASGMGYSIENTNPSSSHLSCLKAHKGLSNDAANILSMWYERHLQYPYPTEEEVKKLSELTGVTEKQVKKWMANKRIRCFNTLSITGNKHPIKFKYEGRGKKRTRSGVGKDDSSSFKPNSNGLTVESRRILNNWFDSHLEYPYPLEEEKKQLAEQCGITFAQVKSWFANKRSRTNKTRKQIPNYFIKKFPQYASMVQVIGQQREQARATKKCQFSNFTNSVPFMKN